MLRIILCALAFGLVTATTASLLVHDDRLDPASGLPRLYPDEKHVPYAADGSGPWVVSNGRDAELICLNGKRMPLRRGAFFLTQASDLLHAGLPEFAAEDFPLFRSRDEYTQEIIRCRDGEVLWSGPAPVVSERAR